ncbi:MAG TPA: aminotransferase class V-fold PLP-dependent enzyme, partial [Acidimicrobiales bacterium]|nr:aminotransferase class V-fold PLP-dependent enzyme [Acidimicrobiales bacterium]
VEARGLLGAPPIRVVASEERHATIDRSLRLLGLGADVVRAVAADDNGAIDTTRLAEALDATPESPTIVCVQAGNVNTGACDDLAAARHDVLGRVGWDVEARGLLGAPPIRVVASQERHATIDRSLRLLGLGADVVRAVAADDNGAIDTTRLAEALDASAGSPIIVCVQAGNVNTGACDDLTAACEVAHQYRAWIHVDGAFGLWAAASPSTQYLTAGIEHADSWATDGHKWLNVPYDSGYVFCADPQAHAASMSLAAAYLVGHGTGGVRAPSDFVPESSRRARGFATWAGLCELGRHGVAELVERCCGLARRFADELGSLDGVCVANDVVLNQVLVSFGDDNRTDRVIAAIQRDGTCWMGGTTWHGRRLMRISVSGWTTTESDVDRSVAAIERILSDTP